MKIMRCPLNGERNIQEFTYFGPIRVTRDPAAASDDAWAEHLFFPPNPAGLVREWWCHLPTNYFFIVERDTRTDEIIRTYAPTEWQEVPTASAPKGKL